MTDVATARDMHRRALWANEVMRACLLEAGDDVAAAISAADVILGAYPDAALANFNPDQPRVPAGKPEGGEWTTLQGAGGMHHIQVAPQGHIVGGNVPQQWYGKHPSEIMQQAAQLPPIVPTTRPPTPPAEQSFEDKKAAVKEAAAQENTTKTVAKKKRNLAKIGPNRIRRMGPDYSLVSVEDGQKMKASVMAYYDGAFTEMNTALRTGGKASPEIQQHIDNLKDAFDKVGYSLESDTVVYRVVKKMPFDVSTVGAEFVDDGFVSTTSDGDIARGIGIGGDTSERRVFKIIVPKGMNVIAGMSGQDDAKEITLPPGCKFRVVKVGRKVITGQEIALEVVRGEK